jgi:hypothetical protein
MTQKNSNPTNYLDLDSLITEQPRIIFHDATAIVIREILTEDAMQLFSRAKLLYRLPPEQRITAMAETLLSVAEEPERAAALIESMSALDLLKAHQWLFNMDPAELVLEKPKVIGRVKMNEREYEILPISYGTLKVALRASGQDPDYPNLTDEELYELNLEALARTIGAAVEEVKALPYISRNRLEAFLEKQLQDAILQVVEAQRAELQRGNVTRGLRRGGQ